MNRIIRCNKEGWQYEADPRHAEYIIRAMNLQDSNPVCSPEEAEKPWMKEEEEKELDIERAHEYKSLAARANYLAPDRPDIQNAVKELCKAMAKPTVGDRRKIKRLARYLKGCPRVISNFKFQERQQVIDGYSDSDWAGCKKTSRSTSGGAMLYGSHLIKGWSSTQKNITLSSGEAELVAAVKMSSELIGITQLSEDWGMTIKGKVHVDSNAAIGIVKRKGCGKLRHVRVGDMWI